ncbi:hypothetical protein [Kitasatospora sp. GP82]|uniref:ParB/RepB/Spo0J family partition protein n=1 Tax=Kitasatospora sp. GP82 TaxID=3035089 RepID=UPI0024743E32|nr:hypothetical protein [Kitasatospora sp. GP82]MDH6130502.1 ParB-like chromosome segregation protein Spo0J [Kitasatospora sp. GP82]
MPDFQGQYRRQTSHHQANRDPVQCDRDSSENQVLVSWGAASVRHEPASSAGASQIGSRRTAIVVGYKPASGGTRENIKMPRAGAGGSANTDMQAEPVNFEDETVVLREKELIKAPKPKGLGVSVPLDEVAPCPQNLRGDELYERPEDRQRLVTQLRENGLIHALVVLDMAVYLDMYPEDAHHFNSSQKYVIVAGHCRFDCAPDAGLELIRVDVQNQYVDKLTEVFLGENIGRNALTVFQEAEGYSRLHREKKWSHRQIAENAGVAKSSVTKKIAILSLAKIPEAKEAVLQKRPGPETAYHILKEVGDPNLVVATYDLMQAERLTIPVAARKVLLSGSSRTGAVGPEAEDAQTAGGGGSSRTGEDSGPEGKADNRTGSSEAGDGGSNDTLPNPRRPAGPGVEEPNLELEAKKLRAEAAEARAAACQDLVTTFVSAEPDAAALRTAATTLSLVSKKALELAHSWMAGAEAPNASAMNPGPYRDHVLVSASPTLVAQFAYAAALAEDECRTADSRRKIDFRVSSYLQHLVDGAGYEPSELERPHLKSLSSSS